MKEMKGEIADILAKHYLLPIESMTSVNNCEKWCDDVAKEITSLYNKELAFEIACNPDVMEAETNNKMYQEQIAGLESKLQTFEDVNYKQARLIEAQDELLDLYSKYIKIEPEDDWKDRYKDDMLCNKIAELSKELK